MQPPFDISADLDTPVSTYLKLGPLQPRYLLESVEGGKHLARYSFLGFGDVLEFRLDESGMRIGEESYPQPGSSVELLNALRNALARTPKLTPVVPELPFSGGLVGLAGYDLVRYFERFKSRPDGPAIPHAPEAAYMATDSVLVFDHLTRRIALLHAGSADDRAHLRAEVIRLLRGPLPPLRPKAHYSAPIQSLTEEEFMRAVALSKDYITQGEIYQIVLSIRFVGHHALSPFETYRAMRLLNPSPYMFFCDVGDLQVVGALHCDQLRARAPGALIERKIWRTNYPCSPILKKMRSM
jgi:anthranilate synthase component 1